MAPAFDYRREKLRKRCGVTVRMATRPDIPDVVWVFYVQRVRPRLFRVVNVWMIFSREF